MISRLDDSVCESGIYQQNGTRKGVMCLSIFAHLQYIMRAPGKVYFVLDREEFFMMNDSISKLKIIKFMCF
jgi:hypothetical protein